MSTVARGGCVHECVCLRACEKERKRTEEIILYSESQLTRLAFGSLFMIHRPPLTSTTNDHDRPRIANTAETQQRLHNVIHCSIVSLSIVRLRHPRRGSVVCPFACSFCILTSCTTNELGLTAAQSSQFHSARYVYARLLNVWHF